MRRDSKNKYANPKLYSEPKLTSQQSSSKYTYPTTPTKRMTGENNHSNDNKVSHRQEPVIQMGQLLYNINDTYEDLVSKNAKLRSLIIQASSTITELTKKCQDTENNSQIEKTAILSELNKISKNYQIYAESYKQMNTMQSDFKRLNLQYSQNNKVMELYQQSIVSLLKDNMKTFTNISEVLENGVNQMQSPHEFFSKMRVSLKYNLNQYQPIIDSINFDSFFEEYTSFLSIINGEESKEPSPSIPIKKRPMIRKKEYLKNHSNSMRNINTHEQKNTSFNQNDVNSNVSKNKVMKH